MQLVRVRREVEGRGPEQGQVAEHVAIPPHEAVQMNGSVFEGDGRVHVSAAASAKA